MGVGGWRQNRSRSLTREAEFKQLRKVGLQGTFQTEDGVFLFAPGGGYATSGRSLQAVMGATVDLRRVHHWEEIVREALPRVVAQASARGLEMGQTLEFHRRMLNDEPYALCDAPVIKFRLPTS